MGAASGGARGAEPSAAAEPGWTHPLGELLLGLSVQPHRSPGAGTVICSLLIPASFASMCEGKLF